MPISRRALVKRFQSAEPFLLIKNLIYSMEKTSPMEKHLKKLMKHLESCNLNVTYSLYKADGFDTFDAVRSL